MIFFAEDFRFFYLDWTQPGQHGATSVLVKAKDKYVASAAAAAAAAAVPVKAKHKSKAKDKVDLAVKVKRLKLKHAAELEKLQGQMASATTESESDSGTECSWVVHVSVLFPLFTWANVNWWVLHGRQALGRVPAAARAPWSLSSLRPSSLRRSAR